MHSNPEISVIVGGRFHADRMVDALSKAGYPVRLLTSYPKSRFPGVSKAGVHSFLFPEIAFRLAGKLGLGNQGDLYKMHAFGRTVSNRLSTLAENPDLLFAWSSFGLETFRQQEDAHKILVRDSAHIEVQSEILREEYGKWGIPFPNRSRAERRELEEYELADTILVCSGFAERSFISKGIPKEKLRKISLGVDTSRFTPNWKRIDAKRDLPLKVIYFGSLSLQKGIAYLLEGTKSFSKEEIQLTLVGPVSPEARPLLSRYSHYEYEGPLDHTKLAPLLAEQDIFVFPSLHDGFGLVLPQAMACGVVPLVSTHCGAADMIEDGRNGFLFPPANAAAIQALLTQRLNDRARLPEIARKVVASAGNYSWETYGKEIVKLADELLGKKHGIA